MKENNIENVIKKKRDLTLFDYLDVFLNNKKKILLNVFIVMILSGILFFFVIDPVYLSTGVIKTTSKGSSVLSGILGSSGLPDLGDFGDIGTGGGGVASELALYENILNSRKCLEEAIIKFNIVEKEKFKNMFDAYKYFREEIMEISKDKIAGTLSIGVFDTDPIEAKEIADFLIYQLNKINIELNVQDAKNNRVFIEERYNIAKTELKNVEDSLQKFQNVFGIAPEIQVQAALKGEIEIEAEIKSEELKLELLKKILSPDQPEISAQEQKIIELKKQNSEISNSDYQSGKLNLKNSPEIVMNYLRLKRDVEIQNKILTTLIPILEQSKISENKETPTVLILDSPQVPDRKSKPKRLTSIFIFSVFTFVIAYVYFFVKTYFINKRSFD